MNVYLHISGFVVYFEREHDGILALEDQNQRIEDKKRCIEVVQNTCCSSSTPSSIQSGHESDESSQSIQESLASPPTCPDFDCIIPEVEEVDDSTIDIVVGMRKFRIQMTENPKYDPKSPPHNFSSFNMVFDTHATKDDGGKSIPNVLPSFLSGASSGGGSSHRSTASESRANSMAPPSTGSCASIIEMPDFEVEVEQAPEHPSQNGAIRDGVRRCVTIDDPSSLAELLLQKDGVVPPDAGKVTHNRDATVNHKIGGQHLLLRQLLVDKPQTSTSLRNTLADGQDGSVQSMGQGERRPTRNRVLSLESTVSTNT